MTATCPHCSTPLPASITASQSSQVTRCTGCASLILWGSGRVLRATRPVEAKKTPEPEPAPPAATDEPLPLLKPEGPREIEEAEAPPMRPLPVAPPEPEPAVEEATRVQPPELNDDVSAAWKSAVVPELEP